MVKVVQQLLSGADAVQSKDIGVITPYSGQVSQFVMSVQNIESP